MVRQTDYFTRKEIPADRLRVILNRHQNRGIITEAQIEKVIGQKIFWKVPNQYIQMLKSISGGDPLSQAINSEVAKKSQRMGRNHRQEAQYPGRQEEVAVSWDFGVDNSFRITGVNHGGIQSGNTLFELHEADSDGRGKETIRS